MDPTHRKEAISAAELAKRLGGEIIGQDSLLICGVNGLREAKAADISFISDDAHAQLWSASAAGAAVITPALVPVAGSFDIQSRSLIVVKDAKTAMVSLLHYFAPEPARPVVGVDRSATVGKGVELGEAVRIGPHVSIGPGSRLGAGVVIHAGVQIYADVSIGTESEIHANTVIRERCVIGRRVILHPNVTIGADGFGFHPLPGGRGLLKVPQIGWVEISDDVEIGANSCVDRGKFGATVIGEGTKIDNLVQIGHNCRIGRFCVIAGCAGLAGSVTLGDGVQIGGGAGIADHVTIGSGAAVAGGAGVIRDIPAGELWIGMPAQERRETLRGWAAVRKLVGKRKGAALPDQPED